MPSKHFLQAFAAEGMVLPRPRARPMAQTHANLPLGSPEDAERLSIRLDGLQPQTMESAGTLMERTQDAEAVRALQEELKTTRENIARYGQLIEELPWIFEQKFSERLEPILEQREKLLEEQALLQRRLDSLPAESSRSGGLLPAAAVTQLPVRPLIAAACGLGLVGVLSGLFLRPLPPRPLATKQPSVEIPPSRNPASDQEQAVHGNDSVRRITVRPGDTLEAIAGRHGVEPQMIMEKNGLTDPRLLQAGTKLKIPGSEGMEDTRLAVPARGTRAAAKKTPAPGLSEATITVRPGETPGEIAERHGIGLQRLLQANGITDPRRMEAGQTLSLPHPRQEGAPSEALRVIVMPGESLSVIAERHGIDLQRLLETNNIQDPDRLVEGQALTIPPPSINGL